MKPFLSRIACLLLPMSVALFAATEAVAADPTRLDVEIAVNRAARDWVLDADNRRLTVIRTKIPRSAKDPGFACGEIRLVGSPRFDDEKRSYSAMLLLVDGQLQVALLSPLFQPIEQLLAQSICQ